MEASHPTGARERRAIAAPLVGIAIAVLAFLPLANWVPGGWVQPDAGATIGEWVNGSLLTLGIAAVLAVLSRSAPVLWREGATAAVGRLYAERPAVFAAALALLALALHVAVSAIVFDRRPIIIDEVSQLEQARIYAAGRLWLPTPPDPEFFGTPLMVDIPPKWYAQFPAGGPAMLAPFELLGAAWLAVPVWGAAAVLAWLACLRAAEPRAGTAAWAAVLFAVAPLGFFMAGSHMNHTPTLMWLLVGAAGMAHAMRAETPRAGLAFASGLGFGAAATIRPMDALAFAAPAGVWYLVRALRDRRRWADALAAGAGVAIPIALLMWVNVQTTGAPLRFGYNVLWGPGHDPGFHLTPAGLHTPARGLELIAGYFWSMQKHLFHAPVPSLLPVVAALLLARRLGAFDRWLLAASTLLVVAYWTYWFDGRFLGPRFLHPLLPLCALWAARLPALLRERGVTGLPYRGAVYAVAVGAAIAALVEVPIQWRYYASNWASERFDADAAAERAGVRDALVLVREPWGNQLIARMRRRGVSRRDAGPMFFRIDSCILEQTLTALEDAGTTGPPAVAAIAALEKDASRVVQSNLAPGAAVVVLPGTSYTPRCVTRLRATQAGFAPFLATRAARGSNVYARDLHSRDTLLVRRYVGRPLYLLAPESPAPGAPLRFYPIDADSAWRAWRSD